MKILLVHNRYQQPGGELQVYESEGRLLADHGHQLIRYTADNRELEGMSRPRLAATTIWNHGSFREIRALVRRERPDVAHFHNTFPRISPSAYFAASMEGVPVVQTLHNYRLLCANALLFRDGHTCEDCLGRTVGWPGVVHACYRDSELASAGVVAMQQVHGLLGTWRDRIDVYVALSRFAAGKFVEGGIPEARIEIKPNHVAPDPGPGDGRGDYVLYVGRLTPEKGIRTLLRAWEQLGDSIPLHIVGDGPLSEEVEEVARHDPAVRWSGWQPHEAVLDLLGRAKCLIFPSEWYENCPMVILEALSRGTPVLVADMGAAAELVEDARTGLFFRPGDSDDLADTLRRLLRDPQALRGMRERARESFLRRYSAAASYRSLLRIYERARAARAATAGGCRSAQTGL